MFQKLKRRFILTNMAMLTVVLLISFTAIYLITAYHIQSQNLLKLENIHSNTLRYQDACDIQLTRVCLAGDSVGINQVTLVK